MNKNKFFLYKDVGISQIMYFLKEGQIYEETSIRIMGLVKRWKLNYYNIFLNK